MLSWMFPVAIAAEISAWDPVRTRIEVRVTIVTRGAAIDVPCTVFPSHVPRLMCPGIRTAETIAIGVTGNADRVIALCIMAVHAGLDVAPGELGMTAPTAPNAERRETGTKVPRWFEGMRCDIVSRLVAFSAKLLCRMAGVALRRF
jgi:hypothetical protein